MDKVRIGIIGLGNMGSSHARYILQGEIPNAELTAVCDLAPDRLKWAGQNLGEKVQRFDNAQALIASGAVDAVMVATPHYDHPTLAIKALKQGLHVLVEKPAGVYSKQVREMNEVAKKSDRIFGIMYNQRSGSLYQKMRDLVQSGELGELKRTNWIITNWYRSQSYYDSGGWRATWAGEGGGVLLNQAPHNLDIWQWVCGMPVRVRAFCEDGKYHDIEVEDDVTAYVEYENGATGVFITGTGDAPGTNRFEITGDRGKLVAEDGKLTFWRLREPEREFNKRFKGGFGQPECWECSIPLWQTGHGHKVITSDWVNAILKGTPLLAPGLEGINAVIISNAMHLSSWIDGWVELPIDEDLFYEKLQERASKSVFKKDTSPAKTLDVEGTY